MISFLLQAGGITLTQGDYLGLAGILIAVIYLILQQTNKLPTLLKKLGIGGSNSNENIGVTTHTCNTMQRWLQLGNVIYPIPSNDGIQTIKADEVSGYYKRRYYYYDDNGGEHFHDATDDKIRVEINSDLLEGLSIIFTSIGEGEKSANDIIVERLRDKLDDANATIDRLTEDNRELKKPLKWQNQKRRSRYQIPSSRIFRPEEEAQEEENFEND